MSQQPRLSAEPIARPERSAIGLRVSAATSDDAVSLWIDFEAEPGLGEDPGEFCLSAASASVADGTTTFSQYEGPDRQALNDDASRALNDRARVSPKECEYLWALRSGALVGANELPPTPWCDDEFRETLTELLVPEGGNTASDWLLEVNAGLLPKSGDGLGDTGAWEAATAIGFRLDLASSARFQAELVQLLYPQDTVTDASADAREGDYPVFYTTIVVQMEWSSLGRFWDYPLAEDLVDILLDSAADAGSSMKISMGLDGFDDTGAMSLASLRSSDLGSPSTATWVSFPTASVPNSTLTSAPSVTSSYEPVTSDWGITDADRWPAAVGGERQEPQTDPAGSPSSETHWHRETNVVVFGPQGLEFSPLGVWRVPQLHA